MRPVRRGCGITGSPSSKYEHRRKSALLCNVQNIRICMGKKPIVSVTYQNERISIKNSLRYLKCVLRLSCVVHGLNYGRFMGFFSLCTDVPPPSGLLREGGRLCTGYGFLCKRFSLYIKVNFYIGREPLMR